MHEAMHWADILAAIYKADSSPIQIAREEGIRGTGFVNEVIRGKKTSYRVATAIAAKTGLSMERMWPGKYITAPANKKEQHTDSVHELKEVAND